MWIMQNRKKFSKAEKQQRLIAAIKAAFSQFFGNMLHHYSVYFVLFISSKLDGLLRLTYPDILH